MPDEQSPQRGLMFIALLWWQVNLEHPVLRSLSHLLDLIRMTLVTKRLTLMALALAFATAVPVFVLAAAY